MKKSDFKMTDKHRKDLSMRVLILILSVCLMSYLFKILGTDTFNKFITNETFIKLSTFIDTHYWCNILAYGILGYIITQFTFCMTCKKLKLKWFEYIIIFVLSIIMSVLRYHCVGAITYLFDVLQYTLFPILYGSVTRKTPVLENVMNTLSLYFTSNGILLINSILCDLKALMYGSNFIAYVLCFIEIYLYVIAISIYTINGGHYYVTCDVNVEQKERPTKGISKNSK